MPYIKSLNINTTKTNPFPYNISAVKFAKDLDLSNKITFFIGDNGSGKSTLLETIAFRLQMPHMDGSDYSKKSFAAAMKLSGELELKFNIDKPRGFFFRAEDFGDLLNSVNRRDIELHRSVKSLEGEVPEQDKVKTPGIYLLDEPEAALSPAKQLSLIYQIIGHLKNNMSQFIIATHSPMIMAIPNATIYEITEDGMEKTALEDTDHYQITKGFLNNPERFLRHLAE